MCLINVNLITYQPWNYLASFDDSWPAYELKRAQYIADRHKGLQFGNLELPKYSFPVKVVLIPVPDHKE